MPISVKIEDEKYWAIRMRAKADKRSITTVLGRAIDDYVSAKGTTSNALDAVPDPNSTTSRNP